MEQTTLGYSSGPEGRTSVGWQVAAILLMLVAAVVVWTCVRIEILNARVGFYLPRDFSVDAGKWRVAPRDREGNALRDAVSTWGLLQYPLVAVALVGLPLLLRSGAKQWRAAAGIMWVLVAACGGLMIYRGYFSSLGW